MCRPIQSKRSVVPSLHTPVPVHLPRILNQAVPVAAMMIHRPTQTAPARVHPAPAIRTPDLQAPATKTPAPAIQIPAPRDPRVPDLPAQVRPVPARRVLPARVPTTPVLPVRALPIPDHPVRITLPAAAALAAVLPQTAQINDKKTGSPIGKPAETYKH